MSPEIVPGNRYVSGIKDQPFGIELAFVIEDVSAAYEKAVSAEALPIKEPEEKPCGQAVGNVRAIDGLIIKLCSLISG